jgi:hypothetical protein
MIRNLVIIVALTAAAAAIAVPARADQYDFISALDKNGIYYSNINDMIDVGKLACHSVRAHMSGPAVAAQIRSEGGYTQQEAILIMEAAANSMCPDVWPLMNSQNQQPPPSLPPCAPNCGED